MLGSFVGVADYGAFIAAIIIFLLIPGPGNLALITSTGKGGIAGGMGATLGVIAGDQLLLWAAVAGVSAVMLAYPAAFRAVQWAGAAYLAWLGLKMLLTKPGDVLATSADTAVLDAWIGFKPATPVELGVQKFVSWYRQHYAV